MRRQIKGFKSNKISKTIINHIKENINLYFISIIIFITGIIVGVIMVNNMSDLQSENVYSYINNTIDLLKNNNFTNWQIIKLSILKYLLIIFIIWIFGITFLGNYFLKIILFTLGINFGYSVSCIIYAIGLNRGLLFIFSTGFFQNIIFITTIIFLITNGIKYNDKKYYEKIKNKSLKFTFISLLSMTILVFASLIEAYINTTLLNFLIKYL